MVTLDGRCLLHRKTAPELQYAMGKDHTKQAGDSQPAKGTDREHFFHDMLKPLGEENWDQIKGSTVSGLR